MALNTSLPLRKPDGSLPDQLASVRISRVQFRYKGPEATLYACIGLKDGSGSFNQGANLLGGAFTFAAVPFKVPRTVSTTLYQINIPSTGGTRHLLSLSNTVPNVKYGTYIWISRSDSARDSDRVALLDSAGNVDVDSGVVQTQEAEIISTVPLPPPEPLAVRGTINIKALSTTFPSHPSTGATVTSWTVQVWHPDLLYGNWVNSPSGYVSRTGTHTIPNVPLNEMLQFKVWLRFQDGEIMHLSDARGIPEYNYPGTFTVDGQVQSFDMRDGSLS